MKIASLKGPCLGIAHQIDIIEHSDCNQRTFKL